MIMIEYSVRRHQLYILQILMMVFLTQYFRAQLDVPSGPSALRFESFLITSRSSPGENKVTGELGTFD